MNNPPSPSPIKSYRDLQVWQKSIQLAKRIYEISAGLPPAELYGLTSQIRRAAVSVPSNIAEGQARRSQNDFKHFLRISLGSLAEIDTQLEIAKELDYFSCDQIAPIQADIVEIRRMLYALINAI